MKKDLKGSLEQYGVHDLPVIVTAEKTRAHPSGREVMTTQVVYRPDVVEEGRARDQVGVARRR